MEAEHTKGEWRRDLIAYDKDGTLFIYSSDRNGLRTNICEVLQTDAPPKEAEANAEFIVRACDAHDELVLELVLELTASTNRLRTLLASGLFNSETLRRSIEKQIRYNEAALAKAKGE